MTTPTRVSELMAVLNDAPSSLAFTEARGIIDSSGTVADTSEYTHAISPAIDRWPSEMRIARTTWENLSTVVKLPSWQTVRMLEILSTDRDEYSDDFSNFVRTPQAAHLRAIFWRDELSDDHIDALIASKHTSNLETLSLTIGSISDGAIERLARSKLASQLVSLRLAFPLPSFGRCSQGYEALFAENRLPHLASLTAIFPPVGFIRFIDSNRPKQLKTLRLQLFDPASTFDEVVQSGELLKYLQSLQMPCSNLGNRRVHELLISPYAQSLVSLDLTDNDIGADGLRPLSKSSSLPNLLELQLGLNPLGDEGWRVIGNLMHNRLTSLCLDKTHGGDAGVQFLEESWKGDTLRMLSLQGNEIGPRGAEVLANSDWTRRLSELRLDSNPLGDDGAAAIAKGSILTNLAILSLRHVDIGERGFSAILDSTSNRLLNVLLLDGANLAIAPFRKLSISAFSAALRELSLAATDMSNHEISALCSVNELSNLRILRLAVNQFDDAAVQSFKTWSVLRQLWSVDLSHSNISDIPFEELVAAGALQNVAELRIDGTNTSGEVVNRCLKYMPRLKTLVHHKFRNWTY